MEKKYTLVDTHAHLDFQVLNSDLSGVVKRALESGVKYIITVGGGRGPESNIKAINIAEGFENVYASVGLHPDSAKDFNGDTEELLTKLSNHEKVVAIGETGFDFKCDVPQVVQRRVFEFHLDLARKKQLPLIIHSREAFKEVLEVLESSKQDSLSGVFHCFSGETRIAKRVLDLGFYISFTGIITFKNAGALSDIVKYVPIERILIETDAPFLSPEPFRGRTNEPSRVVYIAQKISAITGFSYDDVARMTSFNSRKLFGVGDITERGAIAYFIRDSLYLNITNRCTNSCRFCPKVMGSYIVKGYDLKIENEPSVEDLMRAIGEPYGYKEVVFCGFGEPLLRLDVVKEVAKWLKEKNIKVRIDTDGLANLVHGRNILPELEGIVDAISVSLNAPDADTYFKLCPSRFGKEAFNAVVEFIKNAPRYIPEVIASVVALPDLNIDACRRLAEELGVKFRVRGYNSIG